MISLAPFKHWQKILILYLATTLGACSATDLHQYADNTPVFSPPDFFNGHLTAHGVIKNRSGDVTRYFTATIDASWNQGIGTLAERFEFNDGEIQFRTWTLTPNKSGGYNATAGDVIGTGLATTSGNAMQLDYVLEIDYRGKKMNIDVEDWMWRVDETTVINHSILRKWGFKVGSIQLAIIKH
jgi:hypothetical protein